MRIQELLTDDQRLGLPVIADKDLTNPASANTLLVYIVAASAVGLWSGQDGKIAYYDQQWRFLTPVNGWQVLVDDENAIYTYQDSAWSPGAGVVNATGATLTMTKRDHAGKTTTLNKGDGQAVTLPASIGDGSTYDIILGTAVASVGTTIKVANATDVISGKAFVISDNSAAVLGYAAGATDDTITLDGSTTGGKKGDRITIKDVAAGTFHVLAFTSATGTEATPFSATVS